MLAKAKLGISITHWKRTFGSIWHSLSARQKWAVGLSMCFPVLNQATQILAFYFTIQILMRGIGGEMSGDDLWKFGGAIAVCFAGSGLTNWLAKRIDIRSRIALKRVVRRFIALKYLKIREMGLEEAEAEEVFAQVQASEHHFQGPMINALNSVTQLSGSFLMVMALMMSVALFAPVLAGIITLVGLVLVFLVRCAKSDELHADRRAKDLAIKDMNQRAKEVLKGEGDREELIEQYLENDLDRISEKEDAARQKIQQIFQGIGAVFTTVILVSAMNLVDPEAFRGFPEAALIAFLLMLKICLQSIQNMVSHWGHLHRDRNLLTELGIGLEEPSE